MLNLSKASSSSNDVYFYDNNGNLWRWHRLRHELELIGWGVEFTGAWIDALRWLVREGCLKNISTPLRRVTITELNQPLTGREEFHHDRAF